MKRILLLVLLLLGACDSGPPPPQVVVYAPAGYENARNRWLEESDFQVTVILGDSAKNTDKIIAGQDSPRADVLITSSAIDIWRAGDQGALRPMFEASLRHMPPELRDPDNTWAAVGHSSFLIGFTAGEVPSVVRQYADLGSSEFAGQLCLTSSSLPANRALIGMLIEDLGLKPAERVVRSWVRNLAQVPYSTEAELVDALESGVCGGGIVLASPDTGSLTRITPEPTYRDIHGIGVTRHAENPEAGQQFVERMLSKLSGLEPVNSNGKNIGIAGWRDEEARLLAERAGYR